MGTFDKYALGFSREKLSGVLSAEQVDEFLSAPSLEEQRQLFDLWPVQKLRQAYRYDSPRKIPIAESTMWFSTPGNLQARKPRPKAVALQSSSLSRYLTRRSKMSPGPGWRERVDTCQRETTFTSAGFCAEVEGTTLSLGRNMPHLT